ncbi:chymotrypsinogen B-like [Convolutriloba macropyga]|uniref:chymotrypsinogen B-like n=1 Tax=Convolutriloba macropyga TaxID=536237 RepID=UPI003F51EC5D
MLLSQQVQLVLFLPLLSLYFCREFDTDQSLRKQKISDRFQTLIINGYPSGKSRFFAYIGFSARYKFCGGAVIAKYWVITVALCLYLSDGSIVPADQMLVKLGDFTRHTNRSRWRSYNVRAIFTHNGFTKFPRPTNDIALLRLASRASNARIVNLCNQELPQGTLLHFWGMGSTSTMEIQTPSVLHEAQFLDSKFKYSNIWNIEFCDVDNVCVDPVENGTNTCAGDAGGPLFYPGIF